MILTSRSITDHCRTLQVSPSKLKQCAHSAPPNELFQYVPVNLNTAMPYINIELRISNHISHESVVNAHHHAENCMKI